MSFPYVGCSNALPCLRRKHNVESSRFGDDDGEHGASTSRLLISEVAGMKAGGVRFSSVHGVKAVNPALGAKAAADLGRFKDEGSWIGNILIQSVGTRLRK